MERTIHTIAFYPTLPEYVQLLYEIEMDRIDDERLEEIASELVIKPDKRESEAGNNQIALNLW